MPEARGRLPKGGTARLELSEGRITVSVQKGFIGKKMVPFKEIRLENVSGVELLEGEKPFKGSKRLGLKHEDMEGGGELVFYSAETDQIEEIHRLIVEELARREEELRRQMTEYTETRERQLNMLYQDLEMIDHIFDFVLGLGGEVDWRRLHDVLEGMRGEAAALLEVVLQGVTEASTHRQEWFNSRYHHLFASTLFLLRSRELARLTGAADEGGERRLSQQAEALMALVGSECPELEDYDVEGFDRARLYSLVDLLVGVPFTPGSQAQ